MSVPPRPISLGRRLLYRLFEPRPRIVSSAITIALAAAALAFVVPPSRMATTGRTWTVFASKGQSGVTISPDSPERPVLAHWAIRFTWKRTEQRGRISGELGSGISAPRAQLQGFPLPTPEDTHAVLLAWAERTGEDDPLLLAAIRSPSGRAAAWDLNAVAVEAGHWAVKLMFLGALVLGVGRLAVRSGYERSIRWWRDGRCPECGYMMEGVPGGVCPECGCAGAEHVRSLLRILRPK